MLSYTFFDDTFLFHFKARCLEVHNLLLKKLCSFLSRVVFPSLRVWFCFDLDDFIISEEENLANSAQ
jgi:hypothetical protein